MTFSDALQPVVATSPFPQRCRTLLALKRRDGVTPAAFEAALAAARVAVGQSTDAGELQVRAGVLLAEQQPPFEQSMQFFTDRLTAIDGYLSIDTASYAPTPAQFEGLFAALAACRDVIADVIAPSQTFAFAGVANFAIPGVGPVGLLFILEKHPDVTLPQYNTWWVKHGFDHRRIYVHQLGYHQLHVDPELNARAATAAGVATTHHAIIDCIYLKEPRDQPPPGFAPEGDAGKAYWGDVMAHCTADNIMASFFAEL